MIERQTTTRMSTGIIFGLEKRLKRCAPGLSPGVNPFLVFINDLDTGIENFVFKFADDTKLLSTAIDLFDRDVLHSDLNLLVTWSRNWQMQFNIGKCKVMPFGYGNQHFEYYMDGHKSVATDKDLGMQVSDDLKSTVQCSATCKKANRVLGIIYRHIDSKVPDIMLRLLLDVG